MFIAAAGAVGAGDAFARPALAGLTVDIVSPERIPDGNALLGMADAATRVAGPALAGLGVALAGPAALIAVDAGTYAVSAVALALLRLAPTEACAARSPVQDLRDGWAEFRARRWLVATTVQFTLFNLFTWGPFLCLGPVLAARYLGGAGAWGAVMACYGGGAVLGGLLALGRRPGRPVAAATAATFAMRCRARCWRCTRGSCRSRPLRWRPEPDRLSTPPSARARCSSRSRRVPWPGSVPSK